MLPGRFVNDAGMSADEPLSPILDEAGRIAVDFPCWKCAYNLRTLDPESVCPECGTSIVDVGRICFTPRWWVRRVARGIVLVIAVQIVLFSGIFIGPFFVEPASVPSVIGDKVRASQGPAWMALASLVGISVLTSLGTLGAWLMTTPHPSCVDRAGERRSRRLTRLSMWWLPFFLIWWGFSVLVAGDPRPPWLAVACDLMLLSAFGLFVVMTIRHLAVILERIPSRRLTLVTRLSWMASILLFAIVFASTTIAELEGDIQAMRRPPFAMARGPTMLPPTTTQPATRTVPGYYVRDEEGYTTLTATLPASVPLIGSSSGVASRISGVVWEYAFVPAVLLVLTVFVLFVLTRFAVGRAVRQGRRLTGVS